MRAPDPIFADLIRPATPADAPQLWALLAGEMARGLIRSASRAEVESVTHQHLVWFRDGRLLATGRLKPYGEWTEFSRFAVAPGGRGRGHARRLGAALLDHAAEVGYQHIFGLSVAPAMWRLFAGLGMRPVARETLPADWRRGYDFARPSRAFSRPLGATVNIKPSSPRRAARPG